jgi:hypothetical protein
VHTTDRPMMTAEMEAKKAKKQKKKVRTTCHVVRSGWAPPLVCSHVTFLNMHVRVRTGCAPTAIVSLETRVPGGVEVAHCSHAFK